MNKLFLIVFAVFVFTACTSVYQTTVDAYIAAAAGVKLGDSKESVLAKLGATQSKLSPLDVKLPEVFHKDGKLIEVFYFRSGWQDDGITTDDEFTPYIFENGILKAVGWTVLGGPKTQGQSRPQINIDAPHYPYHHYYPYY